MSSKEHLKAVVDAIIRGDEEGMRTAFAPVVQIKSQEILGYSVPKTAEEPIKESLYQQVLREWSDLDNESPIRLQGDRVFVDGKEVGVIQSDVTDFDSGINFIEAGGRFSKEFEEIQSLFDFLIQRYSRGNK